MITHLVAVLALSLVSPSTSSIPRDARPIAFPTPASSDAQGAPAASPLPSAPRAVKLARTSDGMVLTWNRPPVAPSREIVGYVVIVDGQPLLVDASTFRFELPPSASAVAVATMNDVGCSLAAPAAVSRSFTIASHDVR